MKPKILSLGYSVPKFSYGQREIFQALNYPRHFWRIFEQSDIDNRYFCMPIESIMGADFQLQQDIYRKVAVALSCEAINQCLDGRNIENITRLTYGTCTGLFPGPSASHYIAKNLGMLPWVYHSNIVGQGCESGFPNLKIAADYVQSSEGKMALVVNCELCDLTYYPEPTKWPDEADDYSLLRANALFGDAAVACLVGYDDDWRHPTILDTETYTDYAYLNDLGYRWENGRLRAVISKRVPVLAAGLVYNAVTSLLHRINLDKGDIKWWVVHAAGNSVLDNIRISLGLSEEQVRLSRETLRNFGNTSSTSVGISGKRLMSENISRGDFAIMVSIGPGMTGGATLLQFM